MGAPTIEKIRDGVEFTPAAAASFRKAEAEWGRPIDVNSTYRDWNKQMSMYKAWNAYVNGTGPHPGHSRAIHPDLSKHSQGLAIDSDDWTSSKFRDMMARHGWIRTAAWDKTEQHHFEYQSWNDRHINDLDPKDEMLSNEDKAWMKREIAKSVWTYKSVVNKLKFGDMLRVVYDSIRYGKKGVRHHGATTNDLLTRLGAIELELKKINKEK